MAEKNIPFMTLKNMHPDDVAFLESYDIYRWWSDRSFAQNSSLFAQNPGWIRTIIDVYKYHVKNTLNGNQGRWIWIEVKKAVQEHGLDPFWKDYVRSHFPDAGFAIEQHRRKGAV